LIHLPPNISPDETIDALYVFTNCEQSISPNSTVIDGKNPAFIGVTEILKRSVEYTVQLLTRELEIRLDELENEWHKSSLEKIFIEERMYKKAGYENASSKEIALDFLEQEFKPFLKLFRREILRDDLNMLFEIKMGRILKFNKDKADEFIKSIELEIEEVKNHLNNIIEYSINYYKQIKKKYGKDHERKTELRHFEQIDATEVVVANTKLYANFKDGFIGTSLKKDDFLFDCSDIDDIIVFRNTGAYIVTKCQKRHLLVKILYMLVFLEKTMKGQFTILFT
jgi:topoisomerase IV subunit A